MWNLDTVLASKPVLPLARNDCKDGVISLDNIHNDVSVCMCSGGELQYLYGFLMNMCFHYKFSGGSLQMLCGIIDREFVATQCKLSFCP